MSSPKKIGRWNRFEIAFMEGNWPKMSFFQAEQNPTPDKTRVLGKIGRNASDGKRGLGEIEKETSAQRSEFSSETSEQKIFRDNPTPEESAFEQASSRAFASPSLWEQARQKNKKREKKENRRW